MFPHRGVDKFRIFYRKEEGTSKKELLLLVLNYVLRLSHIATLHAPPLRYRRFCYYFFVVINEK